MTRRHGPSRQRGVSGMLVIAALVLFGGMAVYGVSMVTSVHTGYAQEVGTARAKQAAETGLDWARYRIKVPAAPVCAATQTLTLPSSLVAYRVTVECRLVGNEGAGPAARNIYWIRATACNVPGPAGCPNTAVPSSDYVEKQLVAWVER